MGPVGFSVEQQDLIWAMWRRGDAIREMERTLGETLPAHLRRSLTWDRGLEMAHHARITAALSMPVFFCDPHHPWQL